MGWVMNNGCRINLGIVVVLFWDFFCFWLVLIESLRRELDLAIKIRKKFRRELVFAFQMCESLRRQLDFGLNICEKLRRLLDSAAKMRETLHERPI